MNVQIRIQGASEVEQAMRELPRRVDRRLLNKALLAGAKLNVEEAKAKAPVLQEPDPRRRAGTLRRRIRAFVVKPEGYTATAFIGVVGLTKRAIARWKQKRAKKGLAFSGANNPNDPFYWIFQEFGTEKMPPHPFLRPAFEATKEAAVYRVIDASRTLVQAEIAKIGARGLFRARAL